jgi:hypothetical protein
VFANYSEREYRNLGQCVQLLLMSRVQTFQMLLRDVTSSDGLAAFTFYHGFRGFSFSYVMSRVQTVRLLSRDVTSSDGLAAVT